MDKLSEHAIRMLEIVNREGVAHMDIDAIAQAVYDLILQVQMLKMADRKTENSSEKPNNCETCRFELYCPEMCEGCCEWDSHYEPKTEPQTETQTETQNSNLTFEKRTMLDCYNCKRYETEGECIECKFEPKDEQSGKE